MVPSHPADGLPPISCPQCINNWHRRHGYTSSLELPDNTLNFIKKHPLMEEQVGPRWSRPLLVKKGTNFTHLVADRVTGLDGATYTVLFIGTGGCMGMQAWLLEAGQKPMCPGQGDLELPHSPVPCHLHLPVCTPQEMAGCSRP